MNPGTILKTHNYTVQSAPSPILYLTYSNNNKTALKSETN